MTKIVLRHCLQFDALPQLQPSVHQRCEGSRIDGGSLQDERLGSNTGNRVVIRGLVLPDREHPARGGERFILPNQRQVDPPPVIAAPTDADAVSHPTDWMLTVGARIDQYDPM